jgi:hypothetical protein
MENVLHKNTEGDWNYYSSDNRPKMCPYSIEGGKPSAICGSWCALFGTGEISDDGLVSVFLNCSQTSDVCRVHENKDQSMSDLEQLDAEIKHLI